MPFLNSSFIIGVVLVTLEEVVIQPLLKKLPLDPSNLNINRPVSNLEFLGKVLKCAMASQLQRFLDEAGYLNPFQTGFSPDFGTEPVLVDDLRMTFFHGKSIP